VLSLEARVLRIDALLALGRRSDALTQLETLPLDRVGRGAELRLVRAELRASGDCRSALADFDRVLSATPAAGAEERALRGRSLCRASLGDAVGARSDADRYLEKYPRGRFAAELRAVPR
jgi:regulator of sirC expression with transglutaminase-like and TPR domain